MNYSLPLAFCGIALLIAVTPYVAAQAPASQGRGGRGTSRLSVDLGPNAMTGLNLTAAISPDGRRLVFPARGPDGKQELATRLLDQAEPTLLTGTEGGRDPFFSPDGLWIGFFAGNQPGKSRRRAVRPSC